VEERPEDHEVQEMRFEGWWDFYLIVETTIEVSIVLYSYNRGFYEPMFLQIIISLVSMLPGISRFKQKGEKQP
jgi:hypothetical protein